MKKKNWYWIRCKNCDLASRVRGSLLLRGDWYCLKCGKPDYKRLKDNLKLIRKKEKKQNEYSKFI